MNIEYIKNCIFANNEATIIDCIVKFSKFNNEHMFSANSNDPEAHGREIYARIVAGEFGAVAPYVAPVITAEMKAESARFERNHQLSQIDMVISNPLRWASMTAEQQAAWTTYRQALLDIPQQAGFPDNITWPTSPGV
jgi:hypothetical protein